ncbi:hypothetical protein M501DRAFT_1020138 [Patellaria atrata CBS 101060]|uniref:PHD-type domain-containing protein n=1 Tax=Patellaria atrata CBS 101060 TaxID=1346257 RepID=A0A9P4S323_9PEZI|nr:hypothetical protein M501DRAFT_1020138 [Patellaria atrata CBS 101060]
MPSIRPTRKSSRTSSPFVRNNAESPAPPNDVKKERGQTSLDTWMEPPLRNPVPSFEDHGFERGGVVENMAPLGALPSNKLKAKLKSEAHRRPTMIKNGGFVAMHDVVGTPEPTPPIENRRSQSRRLEDPIPELPPTRRGEGEDDDDYVPKAPKSHSRSAKGTAAKQNSVAATTRPTTPHKLEANVQATSAPSVVPSPVSRKMLLAIVTEADRRARSNGDAELGEALKYMYEESAKDQALAGLLQSIVGRTLTEHQREAFQKRLKKARRRVRASHGSVRRNSSSVTASAEGSVTSPHSPSKASIIATPTTITPLARPATDISNSHSKSVPAPPSNFSSRTSRSLPQKLILTHKASNRSSPSLTSSEQAQVPYPSRHSATETHKMVSTRRNAYGGDDQAAGPAQAPVTTRAKKTRKSAAPRSTFKLDAHDSPPPPLPPLEPTLPPPASPQLGTGPEIESGPSGEPDRPAPRATAFESEEDSLSDPDQSILDNPPDGLEGDGVSPVTAPADDPPTSTRNSRQSSAARSSNHQSNKRLRADVDDDEEAALDKLRDEYKKNNTRKFDDTFPESDIRNEIPPPPYSAPRPPSAKALGKQPVVNGNSAKGPFPIPKSARVLGKQAAVNSNPVQGAPAVPPKSSSALRTQPVPSDANASVSPLSDVPDLSATPSRPTTPVNGGASQDSGDSLDSRPASSAGPSNAGPSHAGPSNDARPTRRQKAKSRTKMSPQKAAQPKPRIMVAGVPPSMERRYNTTVGISDNNNNEDRCYSCSGDGFLVCCDGCDFTFHYTCYDPPMNHHTLPDEFFCYRCQGLRKANDRPKKNDKQEKEKEKLKTPPRKNFTLFAALNKSLETTNPLVFQLDQSTRDCFEGVITGPDGEYLKPTEMKHLRNKTERTYDDDHTKLVDSEGNFILCSNCNKNVEDDRGPDFPRRPIIPCDYCAAKFHYDCLDPPLACRPWRDDHSGTRWKWRCPRHIEHKRVYGDVFDSIPVRAHKVRNFRDPNHVDVACPRGFRNDGNIEIYDDWDDDLVETPDERGFYNDDEAAGIVYRMPARGIVLNFIEKVHRDNMEIEAAMAAKAAAQAALAARRANNKRSREDEEVEAGPSTKRSREDAETEAGPSTKKRRLSNAATGSNITTAPGSLRAKQAALNMVQLAGMDAEIAAHTGEVDTLVSATIAEAPPSVIDALSALENENDKAVPEGLTPEKRAFLELLQANIAKMLNN